MISVDLHIIVNAQAGGGKGKHNLKRLKKAASKRGIAYQIHYTQETGELPNLLKRIADQLSQQSMTKLVIIGGDGTLNQAINALKQLQLDIPLAYFPSGTGNDFARQFKLDLDPDAFLQKLEKAGAQNLALMCYKADHESDYHYAINSLGFGLDGLVVHLNNQTKRKSFLNHIGLGKLSYLSQVFQAYRGHKPFTLTLEIGSSRQVFQEVLLATAMNHAYFGGGIKLVPDARNQNGYFSLVIAHHITLPLLLRVLPHILLTGQQFKQTDKLLRIDCQSCYLTLDTPCYGEQDGEVFQGRPLGYQIGISQHPFWQTFDLH